MSRALLVIDVQNEYFTGKLPVTYPQDSLPRILEAIDAANEAAIPVIMIQHTVATPNATIFRKGTPEWELHPAVAEKPYATLIEKTMPSSFVGTNLEEWLRQHEIDTVVISGYMTQNCCDATARQAMHMGYKVEFLSDATGTLAFSNSAGSVTAEELHRAFLVAQQFRFSQVMTTAAWIGKIRD